MRRLVAPVAIATAAVLGGCSAALADPGQYFHGHVMLEVEPASGTACFAPGYLEDDGPSDQWENRFRIVILDNGRCAVDSTGYTRRFIRTSATQRGTLTTDVGRSMDAMPGLLYLEMFPAAEDDRVMLRQARSTSGPGCQLGSEERVQAVRVMRRDDGALVVDIAEHRIASPLRRAPSKRIPRRQPSFLP